MATLQGALSANRYIGTRIEYYEIPNSSDNMNNTSTVHVDAYIISMNGGSGYNQASSSFKVTVNNIEKSISVPAWNIAVNEVWLVGSLDFTIKHNPDGSKNVTVSSVYDSNSILGTSNLSGNLTLTTIPRASVLGTISNFTVDGNANVGVAFSVPITKYYSGFYNVLEISIYNDSNSLISVATRNNYNGSKVTFSSTELQTIYSAIKKSKSSKFSFKLTTYSNSSKETVIGSVSTKTATGSLSATGLAPTFSASSVSYKDTNAKTVAITNNNQIVIKNYSNVEVTLANKATANKGATLGNNAYEVSATTKNGTVKQSINQSATFPVTKTFNEVSNDSISVKVIDSRSSEFSLTKKMTVWDYSKISFDNSISKVKRTDDVEQATFLTLNGTFYDFPSKQGFNTITSAICKYRVKGSSSNYSEINITSSLTITANKFSLNNFSLGNFDVANEYEFKIVVQDKLSESILDLNLNSAQPFAWFLKNQKILGFGGKPLENLDSGSLHLFGSLRAEKHCNFRSGISVVGESAINGLLKLTEATINNKAILTAGSAGDFIKISNNLITINRVLLRNSALKGGSYVTISNLSTYKLLEIHWSAYNSNKGYNTGGASNVLFMSLEDTVTINSKAWAVAGASIPYVSTDVTANNGLSGGNFAIKVQINLSTNQLGAGFYFGDSSVNNNSAYVITKIYGYK